MIHQAREELHREVLEGKRWTVKQLEHERIGRELRERRDRRVAERAVGIVRHAGKVGIRNRAADKGAHHLAGDLGVAATGQCGDLLG